MVEGGLARHVRKLSEGMVEQGTEVHVLSRAAGAHASPSGAPVAEDRHGVLVHRVPEGPAPRDLDAFVAWVEQLNRDMLTAGRELGRRIQPDLVHGHDWLVAPAAAGLAEALGVPYVTTVHATEYGRHQGWVDKHPQSYIHGVETWMTGRADRVIACSHYMRGQICDVFGVPEASVAVIPNGIDPDDLRPACDEDLRALRDSYVRPDDQVVLLCGRLVYEKGFQIALEALPALARRMPRLKVLVAGSGPYEDELRAQVRRSRMGKRVTFLGWIGDDLLHSLYRIADLCVVPSLYEPFGLVALEAMASGCPCIVADTGGLREVVPNHDVGLRFRSRDPHSLGRMVERVLTDRTLRDSLVAEASEHVLRFDWGDVARSTLELYAGLGRQAGAAAAPSLR